MTDVRDYKFEIGDIVSYRIDPTGVAGTIRGETVDALNVSGERFYTVTFPDQPEALKLAEGQIHLIRRAIGSGAANH